MTDTRSGRVVLGAATVAMGLIAGVFYVFACAVMPAPARSDDRTYVEVMRDSDEVIQNPVFFLRFLGALVLTGVSAWQLRGAAGGRWVVAALAAYALALLVTVVFDVPLNNGLAGQGSPSSLRLHFEGPWVAWNVVRAVLSTVALGCLTRVPMTGRPTAWLRPPTRPRTSHPRPGPAPAGSPA
ncbi:anthrone oxygenase family protein [Streptomyces sp. NPDC007905]|uniref:anthrone oxygenase family protein n=1 Tax=Streptomyces sp. NPDC007905 TaxID=3364788 RepID=UPI0036E10EA9